MGNFFTNPYKLYMLSFGGALLLYPLHWSKFYPPLQNSLVLFLLISFLISWIAARRFSKGNELKAITPFNPSIGRIALISILLGGLWIFEFIDAGGVPVYLVIAKKNFDYREFGIPQLHVFLVTFSSFFASFLFYQFLQSKNRIILIYYLLNVVPALLIFSRGMLLLNLSTSLFIYLGSFPRLPVYFWSRKLPLWIFLLFIAAFSFGVLGTLRVSRGSDQFYDRSISYEIGHASSSFRESALPSELFWFYLYLTSPLANLQNTIDVDQASITPGNFVQWGTNEILPDAISKRIDSQFGWTRKENTLVAEHLNASTVYSKSFAYLGWSGLILMNFVILGFPFLFRWLIRIKGRYYVVGMALLSTMYLFLIFDNMFSFSGFSVQLAFPVLLDWLEKHKAHVL